MNQNKILRVKTENGYEFKVLVDVLKEILTEANITFIRDSSQLEFKKPEKKQAKKEVKKKARDTEPLSEIDKEKELKKLIKKDESEENSDIEEESENGEESENDDESENEEDENDEEDCDDEEESEGDTKKKQKKNPGGIRIIALDEHQTLMIYVKLSSSSFVEYYTRYSSFNVGLDLRELYKFMKGIDKDSIMTISVDKDDEQKIEFHLQNTVKGTDTHYKQKLMDIDDNAKRIPLETKFEMSVSMDTQEFRKICSEMSQFAEYMEIICTGKEITFKCLGDQNELVKTFKNGENGGVKIYLCSEKKKPTVVQAIYSLKYLLTFGKCVNLCDEMQLYLKNDYPLFIQYSVGNLGKMLVGLTPCDEKSIKQS